MLTVRLALLEGKLAEFRRSYFPEDLVENDQIVELNSRIKQYAQEHSDYHKFAFDA